MNAADLPIDFAIRSHVRDICYTNPLPDWYGYRDLNYEVRASTLTARAQRYLANAPPLPALAVSVPAKSGEMRDWLVPAVNDQILLVACARALSGPIKALVDPAHVYSCRPSTDPGKYALMQDQRAAWKAFQAETVKRASAGFSVVEFDIRRAYASANLKDFLAFLAGLGGNATATTLLNHLLTSWHAAVQGIPLINDAVFFLGSAYLDRIDDVVRRSTGNFIRFVDDYRLFAKDLTTAEQLYERIGKDLAGIQFYMNPKKARLSSAADYVERTQAVVASQEQRSSIVRVNTQLLKEYGPAQMAAMIDSVLSRPMQYLNDGVGRSVLGLIEQYHFEVGVPTGAGGGPANDLQQALRGSRGILPHAQQLMADYAKVPAEYWRLIWLTYMAEQSGDPDRFADSLKSIENNREMQIIAQLWARRCVERRSPDPPVSLEEVHDMSYVDAGKKCYGGVVCTGAGS